MVSVSSFRLLSDYYEATFQKVSYTFNVVQCELSGAGFQRLIGGNGHDIFNTTTYWTGSFAVHFYFGCGAFLEAFSQDYIAFIA